MKLPSEYRLDYQVCTYDIGQGSLLKLSNLLRLQQEAGERHLAQGDMAFEQLAKMGMAFLVVRANLQIERLPKAGEHIQIRTWHRGEQRAAFFRCFRFWVSRGRSWSTASRPMLW